MINVTVDLGNYSIKYAGQNTGSFSSRISTQFNPNPEAYDRIQIENEITYIGVGEYDRQFSKIDKNYLPSLLFAMILSIMVDKFNSYQADGYATIAKAA